jgi:hypothetical protein
MKCRPTLWLSFLLTVLIGCKSQSSKKIALEELPSSYWVSSAPYQMQLAITPSTFRFQDSLDTRIEPYRILSNNQILLGNDTVELYLKRGHILSIQPTSKDVVEAEAIQLIYAMDFLSKEQPDRANK